MPVIPEFLPPGYKHKVGRWPKYKPHWKKQQKKYLQKLIDHFGTAYQLAEVLGVHVQTTYQWRRLGRISDVGANMVHNMPELKITRQQLRPDLDWDKWDKHDAGKFTDSKNYHKHKKAREQACQLDDTCEGNEEGPHGETRRTHSESGAVGA